MSVVQPSQDGLFQIVHQARAKGKSYLEIERLYKIPAPRAETMMRDYYKDRNASIDPNEQRLLALDRLEMLIEPLMDMAQLGNIKSAEVLIKNLEAINSLLGLNLEVTKQEITIINHQQTTVIVEVVGSVADTLLRHVQSQVKDDKVLALVEDTWDEVVADSYKIQATKMIESEMRVDG